MAVRDHESTQDGFVVRNVPEGTPPEEIKRKADEGRAQGLKEIDFRPSLTTGEKITGGVRFAGQGASLGWSDEGEAAARTGAVYGPEYEQQRDQIRGEMDRFREEYPKTAFAAEMGGALAPALLTRGRAGRPSLGRVAGYGAGAGTIGGVGYSENQDPLEVAVDAGFGLATGGILSAGMYQAMKSGGGLAGDAFNWIRSKFGTRGVSEAENEVLRMADAMGLTPDEIVARIARGEIMADNATLRHTLRSYYAKGDEALRKKIDDTIANRAESKRLEGVAALQEGLAPNQLNSNMTKLFNSNDQDFEKALANAYDQVIGRNAPEVPHLQNIMLEAVNRLPGAAEAIAKRYQSSGSLVPPFKILDNGAVEWTRIPTLRDAEILRRTLDKEAYKFSMAGDGDIGGNLRTVEKALRTGIDMTSGGLQATRANWRKLEMNREAFQTGKTIFSKQSEDMEILAGKMLADPMTAKYLRLGFMSALNNKMTVGGRKSLASKLIDPETKEGKAFQAMFPADQQAAVIQKLNTSAQAQLTAERVLGGSPTDITRGGRDRIGANVSGEDLAMASTLNPVAIMRVAMKALPKFTEMSPADQRRVVDLLMEENPDSLRKALTNNESMRALGDKLMRKGAVITGAVSTTQSDALRN